MLILNDNRNMPGTQRRLLDWMRTWHTEIPAIAISGCRIPRHDRPGTYIVADLVVITPHACAVIEVKGLLEAVSGILTCPGADAWSMDEMYGKPVHVRGSDVNPFDQLYEGMFHLDEVVAELDGPAPISGLVVVFAAPGHWVSVAEGDRPNGMSVLPGESELLQEWFDRLNSVREQWSAELTHEVLRQLSLGTTTTVNELITAGFTAEALEPIEPPFPTIPFEPLQPAGTPHIPPVAPPRYVDLNRPVPQPVSPPTVDLPMTPPWYPEVAEQLSEIGYPEPRTLATTEPRARRLLENAAAVLFSVLVFVGLVLYGQHHLADVHARHPQISTDSPAQPLPPAAAR